MASFASQELSAVDDRRRSVSDGPVRVTRSNSRDLAGTVVASLILHLTLVGAALAYVPPVVEQPDSVQSAVATFEEVTIPADLYAALVGDEELAGEDEEAATEPEAPAEPQPAEPQVQPEPEMASQPPTPENPTPVAEPKPDEVEQDQDPVVNAAELELESPVEPTETNDPAPKPLVEVTEEELVAEATVDDIDDNEEYSGPTSTTEQPRRTESHESRPGVGSSASVDASASQPTRAHAQRSAGSGAVDRGLLNAHRLRLSRAMEGENRCPREAIRQRVNGVAYVGLTQDASGRVTNVSLKRSAGNELLDREALSFAQGLRRLPAPPDDIQGTEFIVPVVFRCS